MAAFQLAPHEVQAFDPAFPAFDAQRPLIVLAPQFEQARPLVRRRYPAAHPARVWERDGAAVEATAAVLPLDARAWLLPALSPEEDLRALAGLRGVMERLFGPDGCPWDREQTPQTLRRYLLEEVYELVDALDRDDVAGLREELGDVLAHVFMQTALAQLADRFTLEDVVEYATAKFVRRHPHVFGEEEAGSVDALLDRWEAIKRTERVGQAGDTEEPPPGALHSVPRAAPSLSRLQGLFHRAGRAGLGQPEEPEAAIRAALATGDVPALLAAAVRLADAQDLDAEEALREAASRFTAAFEALEQAAGQAGRAIAAEQSSAHAAVWNAIRRPTLP